MVLKSPLLPISDWPTGNMDLEWRTRPALRHGAPVANRLAPMSPSPLSQLRKKCVRTAVQRHSLAKIDSRNIKQTFQSSAWLKALLVLHSSSRKRCSRLDDNLANTSTGDCTSSLHPSLMPLPHLRGRAARAPVPLQSSFEAGNWFLDKATCVSNSTGTAGCVRDWGLVALARLTRNF